MGFKFNPITGSLDLVGASAGGGTGDVVGPATATDNAVAVYDGATGESIKDSVVIYDSALGSLSMTGVAAGDRPKGTITDYAYGVELNSDAAATSVDPYIGFRRDAGNGVAEAWIGIYSGTYDIGTPVDSDKQIKLETGANTGLGNTGGLLLKTGNSPAADSGDITLQTGSAGNERGILTIDAGQVNVSSAQIVALADPTDGPHAATKSYVDATIAALPANQVRYVNKSGNDANNGSEASPFLTIAAAEASISDNTPAKPYVLVIGPGTFEYQAVGGTTPKKPNIHWTGQGTSPESGTIVTIGTGAGGLVITNTELTSGVTFQNLALQTGSGGVIVNQTGYKSTTVAATSTLQLRFFNARLNVPIVFNGTDHNSNSVFIWNSNVIAAVTVRAAGLATYFSYFGSTITVTENASIPSADVAITADTVAGSTTVTLVGGNTYGLIGANQISGTGIIPGTFTGGAVPAATMIIDKPALLTQTGVSLNVTARKRSTVQMFFCRGSNLTVNAASQASFLDGSMLTGTLTVNDTGTSVTAPAEMMRGTLSIGAGTYFNYEGNPIKGLRYNAAAGRNWDPKEVTITQATPAVFTRTAHGLTTGAQLIMSTTGALPTGLTTTTPVYAYVLDANTFHVSTSPLFGSLVNTSGSPSGVQYYSTAPANVGAALDSLGASAIKSPTTDSTFGNSVFNLAMTGTGNTAIAQRALDSLTTGSRNTALSPDGGTAITTGSDNVSVGYQALQSAVATDGVTAVGSQAAQNSTTGSSVTAVGYRALRANLANNNTAVGANALGANTTGDANTAVGKDAMAASTTSAFNCAVGGNALLSLVTGEDNTAIGINALAFSTGVSYNTVVGRQSGINISGNYNTLLGTRVGVSLTAVSNNVGVGALAMNAKTGGSSNIAIGYETMLNGACNSSIAMGQDSARAGGASETISIGGGSASLATSGTGNIAIGINSLRDHPSPSGEVAIGQEALLVATSAVNQTAVGYQALRLSNGSRNTVLGYQAGTAVTTGSDCILIGANSAPSSVTATGELVLGSTAAPIVDAYIGRNPRATGAAVSSTTTIQPGGNPTGTDEAATARTLTLAGARGTGTGAGGDLRIATAPAGSTGASLNALVDRVYVKHDGRVGVGGDPAASAALDVQSTTGAFILPRMTTTERNALTAVNGMMIYNTTDAKFQGYEAGAWANLI